MKEAPSVLRPVQVPGNPPSYMPNNIILDESDEAPSDDFKNTENNIKDSRETVDKMTKSERSGIVYISRIPPTMMPHEVRMHLSPFGNIGRVYLAPDEASKSKKGGGGNASTLKKKNRVRYSEGWVEFLTRKSAKIAVAALNGAALGGGKRCRLQDEIWSLKLLPAAFRWDDLGAQRAYETAVRSQRLKAEISQGRRMVALYTAQSERSLGMAHAEERTLGGNSAGFAATERQMGILAKRFKQRKPIIETPKSSSV